MLSLIESETQMISRLFVYVLGNIWSQCRRLTDLCWVLKSDWARGAPVKPPGLFFVIWLVVRGGKEQYGTQTAYFPLLRQCCSCAKKYANNPFLKHKKCCGVLQCASYFSVFLCCYGGCRQALFFHFSIWKRGGSFSSNTANQYSSRLLHCSWTLSPILYICRGAMPHFTSPHFESKAYEDRWCQQVVGGEKSCFFAPSTLITPGIRSADIGLGHSKIFLLCDCWSEEQK